MTDSFAPPHHHHTHTHRSGQNFFSVMEKRHAHTRKQSCLLEDVFPEHIAQTLLAGKKVAPESHDCVTIYFSDIVSFTTISGQLSAQEVSEMLDRLYTVFDDLAGKKNPMSNFSPPLPSVCHAGFFFFSLLRRSCRLT